VHVWLRLAITARKFSILKEQICLRLRLKVGIETMKFGFIPTEGGVWKIVGNRIANQMISSRTTRPMNNIDISVQFLSPFREGEGLQMYTQCVY
jgi:hypothetical protein